jgi:hypothetical protein
MIDTSQFFRLNGTTLEVFVTGLSLTFTRLAREYQTGMHDNWIWRSQWINEQFSKFRNIANDAEHITLDCRMENIYVAKLGLLIIDKFSIPKEKCTILVSLTAKEELEGFNYQLDRLAEINYCYFHDALLSENIDWENIEIDETPIMSLCSRASEDRATFTKQLLDLFGDKCRISFGISKHYPMSSKETLLYKSILDPYEFPFKKGTDDKILETIHLQHNPPGMMLYKSLVSIVHETNNYEHDRIFLTEKSFKVFAWHQIPIFVATPGHVQVIRELGFDLFDDIIDHSYDHAHPHVHTLKIFSQLKRFLEQYPTVNDVRELRRKLWPRLVANHELVIRLKENRIIEHWPYYG